MKTGSVFSRLQNISLALACSTYLAISLVTDGDVSTLMLLWQDTDSQCKHIHQNDQTCNNISIRKCHHKSIPDKQRVKVDKNYTTDRSYLLDLVISFIMLKFTSSKSHHWSVIIRIPADRFLPISRQSWGWLLVDDKYWPSRNQCRTAPFCLWYAFAIRWLSLDSFPLAKIFLYHSGDRWFYMKLHFAGIMGQVVVIPYMMYWIVCNNTPYTRGSVKKCPFNTALTWQAGLSTKFDFCSTSLPEW